MSAPATAPSSEVSWDVVLDEFERSLDVHAAQFESISDDAEPTALPPWEPPAEVGPIPEHLLGHAQTLLERSDELATALSAELAERAASAPTTPHRRRTHPTTHAASTFSTRL